MVKVDKSGRCIQVLMTFWTRFGWPLVVVDRWLLFRGSFSTKFAWAAVLIVKSYLQADLVICGIFICEFAYMRL